jgi:hypothetical protein
MAYLEEDGVALLVALLAALVSMAVTAATLWGAVETIDWIDPKTAVLPISTLGRTGNNLLRLHV